MTSALVLVDLQEDFLNEPGLDPHRDTIVAAAAALLRSARANGVAVLHIHTLVRRQPDTRMPHWKSGGRWSCMDGSPGQSPPAILAPQGSETVIHKSGFAAADAALRSALPDGARFVAVAGVHLHACVRQAVLDLHQAGLRVCVAGDAVGSHEPAHAAQTEIYLRQRHIPFLSNDKLCHLFARSVDLPERTAGSTARAAEAISSLRATSTLPERIAALEAAAEVVDRNQAKIADAIVAEVGKPIRHARGEARRTSALLRAVAKRASLCELDLPHEEALVRRRPLGKIALITPWNNPVAIAAGQIAPAFVYGNAVLWKPSPSGVKCAALLHQLLIEGGIDPAALHLLSGDADLALEAADLPGIDAVCFTGSTRTGRLMAALCGQRNIPLQAELGGNNGAIIASTADLDRAASLIAEAAFGCAGQRCTATRRAIVLSDVFDSFVARLEAQTAALCWGAPEDEATQVGPMLNQAQAGRIAELVERAKEQGHVVLQPHLQAGGCAEQTRFYPPTIIICDRPDAEVVQEESFGPVLVVQKARDRSDALEHLNGVRQGLAAALFSRCKDDQAIFLNAAQAGILKVNQATVEAGVDVPFLGWKVSGIGAPQHGDANREFFTRAQSVYGLQ